MNTFSIAQYEAPITDTLAQTWANFRSANRALRSKDHGMSKEQFLDMYWEVLNAYHAALLAAVETVTTDKHAAQQLIEEHIDDIQDQLQAL